MFGNIAIGSCTIAITPRITMMMEITMATIGRLMKNFAIGLKTELRNEDQTSLTSSKFFFLLVLEWFGIDSHPGFDFL